MAYKIYLSGGAINIIEGTDIIEIINPNSFDWRINNTTGVFTVRDKIENKSFELGIYSNIQNENGVAYSDNAGVVSALNNITKGSIDVSIQNQYTPIVDLYFSQKLKTLTLDQDTSKGDLILILGNDVTLVIGNYIEMWQNSFWYQGRIKSVAVDTPSVGLSTLTMETPIPAQFTTTEANVKSVNINMNINGSLSPVEFTFMPVSESKFNIIRVLGSMTHAVAGTDDKFGGISKLTNGLIPFKINPDLPSDGYIFNAKTNGDLKIRMYDVDYSDKAGASLYGTNFRRTFGGQDKNGVVIRVNSRTSQYLGVKIRDNLTGLASFNMVIQGHLVYEY